jgi:hypothetical protein
MNEPELSDCFARPPPSLMLKSTLQAVLSYGLFQLYENGGYKSIGDFR